MQFLINESEAKVAAKEGDLIKAVKILRKSNAGLSLVEGRDIVLSWGYRRMRSTAQTYTTFEQKAINHLVASLRQCITEDGAPALNGDYKVALGRFEEINQVARAALILYGQD